MSSSGCGPASAISTIRPQLLSVLTLGRSDLALGAPLGEREEVWLRVTLSQGTLRVQASLDGQRWPLLRLATLPAAAEYRVGPVCGTPERGGMEVAFSDFSLQAPLQRGLADLS
jgi:regulation of enolase protein 1 (concanavalin A-like superfamily)